MAISSLILGAFFAAAQLVSIDTKEMDLSDFLRLMAMMGNMNIVIHPAVQGKVNLMVKDAPWEQVLDSVLKNYGLRKEVEGNLMRIAPASVFAAEQQQTAAIEEARLSALPNADLLFELREGRGYGRRSIEAAHGSGICCCLSPPKRFDHQRRRESI